MHALTQFVKNKAPDNSYIGYQAGLSGGADSVVLLHILSQLYSTHLSAIHINHGISPNAFLWEQFCRDYCNSLNIHLDVIQHKITKSGGESLENNARKIRYQEFLKSKAQVIVLAHHQNDQVETTLSQVFRGSDLHNIAAMQTYSYKQGKLIWRPLLDISRQQIEDYAKEYKLDYISDESNTDISYLRNFIRHRILPQLHDFDQDISRKILNLPQQLQNMLALVDEVAAVDLASIKSLDNYIQVDGFKNLTKQRQLNIIAYYIKQQNLPLPSHRQIEEFIRQALHCQWDKRPQLKLNQTHFITKYQDCIFISDSKTYTQTDSNSNKELATMPTSSR